jgi:hypothetical protein
MVMHGNWNRRSQIRLLDWRGYATVLGRHSISESLGILGTCVAAAWIPSLS